MSDESVDIKVNLKGVTSDVEQKLKEIGDKGKKGIDVPLGSKPGSGGKSGSQGKPSSTTQQKPSQQSAKNYQDRRGFLDKTRNSTATGAHAAQQPQSDYDQLSRGGFYETIQGKVDSLKNAKNVWDDWSKKKQSAKGQDGSFGGSSQNGNPSHGSLLQGEGKAEFKEAVFKNVKVEKAEISKALRGTSLGSVGQSLGMGGSGGGMGGGSRSEGLATGSGKALPFLGIGLMIAGAVAKAASSLGEAHIKAMMSQAGTIGAMGGYVGGGSGYFANSEVAQAHIARGRVSGDSVFGKNRGKIDDQEMKFAAQQGRGLSEIVETMAKLRKESDQGLGYYRGAAQQAGFKNLRQSEFLTKIGGISDSLRSQGFSGNMESLMSTVAGMQLGGANPDPMRKVSIAEGFQTSAAKGIFGGGLVGALALKEALNQNGGDLLKAMVSTEGPEGGKMGMSALFSAMKDNPLGLAVIGKQTGLFSATESQKLQLSELNKTITPAGDISKEQVGFNNTLSLDNQVKEMVAKDGAAKNIAETMQSTAKELIKIGDKLNQAFSSMESATQALIDGSAAGASATMEFIQSLNGKNIMSAVGNFMPGGQLVEALSKISGVFDD